MRGCKYGCGPRGCELLCEVIHYVYQRMTCLLQEVIALLKLLT